MTYKPLLIWDEPTFAVTDETEYKKRTVPKTSLEAYRSVKEMKEAHKIKIIEALKQLKTGGTYEQISTLINIDKAQVNRRLSEMERDGIIYNVGITRPTISGRSAMVRQLIDFKK